MKKAILVLIMLLLVGGASAQNFSAEYYTFYAGQNLSEPSFNLSNIQPGDQGKWVIEVKLNNTYDMSLKLNETNSSDNSCPEPEKALEGQNCLNEGELEQEMKFVAWKETTGNLKLDQSEQKKNVDDWMNMSNPWSFLGSLSPTEDKTIIVRWELPENATNRVMTDSFEFDLVTRASTSTSDSDDSTSSQDQDTEVEQGDGGGVFGFDALGTSNTDTQETGGNDQEQNNDTNGEDSNDSKGTGNSSGTREESTTEDNPETNNTVLIFRITNGSGEPVNDVEIDVSGPENSTGTTNSSGYATFEVSSGDYDVNITKEGYDGLEGEVSVDEGEVTEERFEIQDDSEQENLTAQFFQGTTSPVLAIAILLLLLALVILWYYRDKIGFSQE